MSEYFEYLIRVLEGNNWKEPSNDQYDTYIQAHRSRRIGYIYFEDIHFAWRNYKPLNLLNEKDI